VEIGLPANHLRDNPRLSAVAGDEIFADLLLRAKSQRAIAAPQYMIDPWKPPIPSEAVAGSD
jgi:hypothetical protein